MCTRADGAEYFAASSEARAFVYAEPRKVEGPIETAQSLARILGYEITAIYSDDEVQEEQGGIFDGVFTSNEALPLPTLQVPQGALSLSNGQGGELEGVAVICYLFFQD